MLALITGASSGIGRDMAKELAKRGYDLALVARNEDELNKVKEELIKTDSNIQIKIFALDLTKQENCYKLHDEVKNVDIFINNAGFGLFGRFQETNIEKEVNMIATNVTAYHILMKLYLQDMMQKGSGHILNVASIAGFMPGPLMATYYATKNYIVALTRAVQKEIKKERAGVKVSLLCPGPVNTNFNKVANVKFNLPGLSSEYVAKIAIDKMLKGKKIIVPGRLIKMARLLTEITPTVIVEEISYHMQTRKESK